MSREPTVAFFSALVNAYGLVDRKISHILFYAKIESRLEGTMLPSHQSLLRGDPHRPKLPALFSSQQDGFTSKNSQGPRRSSRLTSMFPQSS
jgi:hypothetical protein